MRLDGREFLQPVVELGLRPTPHVEEIGVKIAALFSQKEPPPRQTRVDARELLVRQRLGCLAHVVEGVVPARGV